MIDDRREIDAERALHRLVLAYADHADARRPEQVAELFEPEASLEMVQRGDPDGAVISRGRRHIAAAVRRLDRFDCTLHLVANHIVDVGPAADAATGEVTCVAHHVAAHDGERRDLVMFIRYHDRYRRHDGRWWFAARQTEVLWTEERLIGPAPATAAGGGER